MSLVKRSLVIKITNTQSASPQLPAQSPQQKHQNKAPTTLKVHASGVALVSSLPTPSTPHTLLQRFHHQPQHTPRLGIYS